MSVEFKKKLEADLFQVGKDLGFSKKGLVLARLLEGDIYATLGFGVVIHSAPGKILVNVTVGVLHGQVEELYSRLTGNPQKFRIATVSTQLGFLMPEKSFKEWTFNAGEDIRNGISEIRNTIEKYATGYFEKMKNLNAVIEYYEAQKKGKRDTYLPILYLIKGDSKKGLHEIEEAIKRQSTPMSEEKKKELQKFAGEGGLVIIGDSFNGKVDPMYLKFVEEYKKLVK